MRNNCILCASFLVAFLLRAPSQAQEFPDIEELIENIVADYGEETDVTSLLEELYYFREYPIELTTATYDDLARLHFLNDFQIHALLNYLDRYGPPGSIYELIYVEGFDSSLVKRLDPFVQVGTVIPSDGLLKAGPARMGGYFLLRTGRIIQLQEGYRRDTTGTTAFEGGPWKINTRLFAEIPGKVTFHLAGEKDPGEGFFSGNNPHGFDFLGAHLGIYRCGPLESMILGDYHVEFGQGLIGWTGMGFRKSPDVLNTRKRPRGFYRYLSTDENRFFRGAALTFRISRLTFSPFLSYKQLDAGIREDSLSGIISFPVSGQHTTVTEIARKDAVREFIGGGRIGYHHTSLEASISWLHTEYSNPLVPGEYPYELYQPGGSVFNQMGIDYAWRHKKILLFGEVASSGPGDMAYLQGAGWMANDQVSFSVLYRNFEPSFYSPYGRAFSESTSVGNEKGLYLATEIKPLPRWTIHAYADAYRFPWLKYGVDAPSKGSDYLLRLEYHAGDAIWLQLQGRSEKKDQNLGIENHMYLVSPALRSSLRFQAELRPARELYSRSRIESSGWKSPGRETQHGYLLYQDIGWTPRKLLLDIKLRFALFDTESYETRIYAYEPDVLYSYSSPPFQGQGTKFLCQVKYSPAKKLSLWMRFSSTRYANRETIGSGQSLISGNTRSDIRMQLLYRF